MRTHQPPSCLALSNAAGGLSLFSGPFPVSPCAVRPERALLRLTGPGIWVRFSPATGQAPRLGGHDPIPSLRPWLYGLGGVPQPLRGPAKWGRYFINPQQLVEGQASHLTAKSTQTSSCSERTVSDCYVRQWPPLTPWWAQPPCGIRPGKTVSALWRHHKCFPPAPFGASLGLGGLSLNHSERTWAAVGLPPAR